MILKFYHNDEGMINSKDKMSFRKNCIYSVPDDLARSFLERGTAQEYCGEIVQFSSVTTTRVPDIDVRKKGVFKRLFK